MFGSKFAATLSRALAARSAVELGAAAAAATTTVVVVVFQQQDSSHPQNDEQPHAARSGRIPSALLSNVAIATPRVAACEEGGFLSRFGGSNGRSAPTPSTTNTTSTSSSTSAPPPQARFSKLTRRRTLQRLQAQSERVTLESKYHVTWDKPLGQGAFGAVYVGTHRATREQVAVKQIAKQHTDNRTFQQEMDALLHIRDHGGHPGICGLRENFDQDDSYFLVLDLVSGGEMFDHLCANGPYSEADAARLIREVASALAFCHGIGLIHGDLKPENLMLSSANANNAVMKLVDFGCAQINTDDFDEAVDQVLATYGNKPKHVYSNVPTLSHGIANTPAYCPPEILDKELRRQKGPELYNKIEPSFDMWALGVILYIMLTGVHPFDLHGTATDEEVERKILTRQAPPLRNSPLTAHLSESAITVMEQLMQWDPHKRLTAQDLLNHPWVRGETALDTKIANSDKRLSLFKAYKSKLEAKVFADMVTWSDNLHQRKKNSSGNSTNAGKDTYYESSSSSANHHNHDEGGEESSKSLLERAFYNLDGDKRGYLTQNDLRRLTGLEKDQSRCTATSAVTNSSTSDDDASLSLSAFSELLSDNLKNRYFPKGHIVYREGDTGEQMFFINSGTIQVTSSDGHTSTRTQGDTFGDGALLSPDRKNSSTIKCLTPVHAIEISRQYVDKFCQGEDLAKIYLSEKDKTRKRERAKRLLRLQPLLREHFVPKGEYIYHMGGTGNNLYILEEGLADVTVSDNGQSVFQITPGEMCGTHSVIFGRPHNASVKCISDGGCKFRVMDKVDFVKLLESNPWWVKDSLKDISFRREFQKAVVKKTNKPFPQNEEQLRELFNLADANRSGKLELDEVKEILLSFDQSFSDADIKEILDALDLDDSGAVKFEELKRMFMPPKSMRNIS